MGNPQVQEFTSDNFERDVLASEAPVVVDFWADWCLPCKILASTIDEIADRFEGRASVGKIDIDDHKELSDELNISAIPTVIIFHQGKPAKRFVGLTKREEIAAAIEQLLDGTAA